jgi:hypothetical protein
MVLQAHRRLPMGLTRMSLVAFFYQAVPKSGEEARRRDEIVSPELVSEADRNGDGGSTRVTVEIVGSHPPETIENTDEGRQPNPGTAQPRRPTKPLSHSRL